MNPETHLLVALWTGYGSAGGPIGVGADLLLGGRWYPDFDLLLGARLV